MKRFVASAAAAFALSVGFCGSASALTVFEHAAAPTAWATAVGSGVSATNVPGTWATPPSTVSGNNLSPAAINRSPFDNFGVPLPNDNGPYIGLSYFAVGPNGGLATSARMTFAINQTSLSFLWGSVDTYNRISFFLDGVSAGAVKGGASIPGVTGFTGGNTAGRGASYVKISGLVFDEILFESIGFNALEWSHMKTTPVPIPAAAWLLGSGLLGLFGLARRKRAASA